MKIKLVGSVEKAEWKPTAGDVVILTSALEIPPEDRNAYLLIQARGYYTEMLMVVLPGGVPIAGRLNYQQIKDMCTPVDAELHISMPAGGDAG